MIDIIQQITIDTRKTRGMTLEKFTDAINELMPDKVTYSLISHWEHGTRSPTLVRMDLMTRVYPAGDWRHDFAAAMIEALSSTSVTPEPAG